MQNYNSYRAYLKSRFGKPVLKIPLNGGFSCPNRDGTKSTIGCTFCDNVSFSPAALNCSDPIEQLNKKIDQFKHKFSYFMPYLQPFSNTYGDVEHLRSIYEPLISLPNVIGLAVGTRPDCFSDPVFDYLEDLSKRTYLSVELGLQSAHKVTLDRVNRGHTVEDFTTTVKRLAQMGIEVVAHVMLGLPGENEFMMIDTAKYLASLPVHGVKIHQLMIINGTEMGRQFENHEIETLTLEAYTELLGTFLQHLRPDQYIHRLMADSRTSLGLIAPLWSQEKLKSLNYIQKYFSLQKIAQGSLFGAVV